MDPNDIKTHVGTADFESVRNMLSKTFGANQPAASDAAVAACIEGEWCARATGGDEDAMPALAFLPAAPAGWSPPATPGSAGSFRYYDGLASHWRSDTEKPHSRFNGLLPMVRIPLPDHPPTQQKIAVTAIGYVMAADHLLSSVDAVRAAMVQRYGAAYSDVARCDVVTPARLGGRFGAIGLYLGYRGAATTPSFFLLEAGLATGSSVRLFTSPDLTKITKSPCDYLPTAFSEISNTYDGTLTMIGDEPGNLWVESWREPRLAPSPRITVNVQYQLRNSSSVTKINPGALTLAAAERIAAIGNALNEPNAIPLQPLLAVAGAGLPWVKKP
jgi:hypothetical protein